MYSITYLYYARKQYNIIYEILYCSIVQPSILHYNIKSRDCRPRCQEDSLGVISQLEQSGPDSNRIVIAITIIKNNKNNNNTNNNNNTSTITTIIIAD